MYKFIYEITGNYIKPIMVRIDYRMDIIVDLKDREVLMYLYNKTDRKSVV